MLQGCRHRHTELLLGITIVFGMINADYFFSEHAPFKSTYHCVPEVPACKMNAKKGWKMTPQQKGRKRKKYRQRIWDFQACSRQRFLMTHLQKDVVRFQVLPKPPMENGRKVRRDFDGKSGLKVGKIVSLLQERELKHSTQGHIPSNLDYPNSQHLSTEPSLSH